jgi:hypothetical protein
MTRDRFAVLRSNRILTGSGTDLEAEQQHADDEEGYFEGQLCGALTAVPHCEGLGSRQRSSDSFLVICRVVHRISRKSAVPTRRIFCRKKGTEAEAPNFRVSSPRRRCPHCGYNVHVSGWSIRYAELDVNGNVYLKFTEGDPFALDIAQESE